MKFEKYHEGQLIIYNDEEARVVNIGIDYWEKEYMDINLVIGYGLRVYSDKCISLPKDQKLDGF